MMNATHRILLATLGATIVSSGCKANDPVSRRAGEPDAGVVEKLEPPEIDVLPTATPATSVAIRGRSDGSRIVVSGGPDITSTTGILPNGSFCHDATIKVDQGVTELTVYAVDGIGGVSDPVSIEVAHDTSAPMPAKPTCAGTVGGGECQAEEICNKIGDENCDGLPDECDPSCNGCADDAYEPNDEPEAVPSLPGRGTYALELCPCRPDWFAFHVQQGERIRVGAEFNGALMDLQLKLFPAELANSSDAHVASSLGVGNSEEIDYVAEATGTYYLEAYVFSLDDDGQGSYSLIIY